MPPPPGKLSDHPGEHVAHEVIPVRNEVDPELIQTVLDSPLRANQEFHTFADLARLMSVRQHELFNVEFYDSTLPDRQIPYTNTLEVPLIGNLYYTAKKISLEKDPPNQNRVYTARRGVREALSGQPRAAKKFRSN